jgi:hypothetical protein
MQLTLTHHGGMACKIVIVEKLSATLLKLQAAK